MPQIIFNKEWVVASELTALTGLNERQIKALRHGVWVEGVHFKRQAMNGGETKRGLLWYNFPLINQLVQEL
ncbi:excisionase family protein [Cronobacter turicensis]|uniref:excisionase family protein n=1 Tax=Cronobacter turicensis TaxID=413502 RepID=UPI0024C3C0F5|nr:excisionase family protein [Cronobacter turicensis]MDK1207804.1 excisionase family protein [Cronobacter turicensis]MDK1216104.1 excisionase family protein [Cronobacter turicensis]MDK1232618.1 excisionase family protein [Cronobacter turicensis]HDI3034267.1 excisionase family protein [Cronobacter turicensis]